MNIKSAKEKINIVDIIQKSGVHITRAGKDYQALCPFHTEKTASFTVSPAKQIFHCFGCGSGGDVIEFVRKYHNLDFPGALEFLGIVETETISHKRINRGLSRSRKEQRRKAREAKAKQKFEEWILSYGMYVVFWTEALSESFNRLSWEQLKELSDLIKLKSTWEYHKWLIFTAQDKDALYSLYQEVAK